MIDEQQNDKAVPRRFWAQHKIEAVLRLLRGEDIETLSRELGVTAAKPSEWRDAFLTGGAIASKNALGEEAEYKRINEKIGDQTMEIELLRGRFDSWRQRTLWGDGGRVGRSTSPSTGQTYGLVLVWHVACLGHPQVFALCPQGCD